VVGACILLSAPAVTLADDDPAGGTLLAQSVFYPYRPAALGLERRLNEEVASVTRRGFPIKVALIGSPADLGGVREMFGRPQRYAEYLELEVGLPRPQPLLVVMADGYGVDAVPASADDALATLARPAGIRSDDLVRAAIAVVARLAVAARRPPPASTVGPSRANAAASAPTSVSPIAAGERASAADVGSSTGGGFPAAPIAALLATVAVAAACASVALLRRRRRRAA
jgi:hypothetical protein